MAEWLRRWTANPLGSARVGSNPILVECHFERLYIGEHEFGAALTSQAWHTGNNALTFVLVLCQVTSANSPTSARMVRSARSERMIPVAAHGESSVFPAHGESLLTVLNTQIIYVDD